MTRPAGVPVIAIIDAKNLRRASIASFLEPWANSEDLRVISFKLDRAHEGLQAETNLRIVIVNFGGESIAEPENLRRLKMLRTLATGVPFVVISDRDNAQEIAAAFGAETNGFIHSEIEADLACEALSFILHGGSYFPPSVIRQLQMQPGQAEQGRADEPGDALSNGAEPESKHSADGTKPNLTVREKEVLKHIRLGESNKMIARQLGMMEATVKVHVRQLMRKFRASNRTQLALTQSQATADSTLLAERLEQKITLFSGRNDQTSRTKVAFGVSLDNKVDDITSTVDQSPRRENGFREENRH
jgi:DNA-binding NarL/FixJ family response regulator